MSISWPWVEHYRRYLAQNEPDKDEVSAAVLNAEAIVRHVPLPYRFRLTNYLDELDGTGFSHIDFNMLVALFPRDPIIV